MFPGRGPFLILTKGHLERRLSGFYLMNNGHPLRHRHYAISILLLSVQALYSRLCHNLTVAKIAVNDTFTKNTQTFYIYFVGLRLIQCWEYFCYQGIVRFLPAARIILL
jgi:hypothetical protein